MNRGTKGPLPGEASKRRVKRAIDWAKAPSIATGWRLYRRSDGHMRADWMEDGAPIDRAPAFGVKVMPPPSGESRLIYAPRPM